MSADVQELFDQAGRNAPPPPWTLTPSCGAPGTTTGAASPAWWQRPSQRPWWSG